MNAGSPETPTRFLSPEVVTRSTGLVETLGSALCEVVSEVREALNRLDHSVVFRPIQTLDENTYITSGSCVCSVKSDLFFQMRSITSDPKDFASFLYNHLASTSKHDRSTLRHLAVTVTFDLYQDQCYSLLELIMFT